ncbi:MAG: hypothetical protein K5Q00_05695 [Gammaproteobacteria bacterium]|nr:hypothetical protein [Gammaproteobacteria bacterium]
MFTVKSVTISGMTVRAFLSFNQQTMPPKKTIYLQIVTMPTHDLMIELSNNGIHLGVNYRIDGESEVQNFLVVLANIINQSLRFNQYLDPLTHFRLALTNSWQRLSTQHNCCDNVVF